MGNGQWAITNYELRITNREQKFLPLLPLPPLLPLLDSQFGIKVNEFYPKLAK